MLVPMRAILEAADTWRYGQAAFNMNSYGQIEAAVRVHELLHSGAVLQGAEASNAYLGGAEDFMHGTIEQKRYWITNATYLYTVYGTPQAIYNFLEGFFQTVQVEENWEYGGDPFHFRVTVSGGSYDAAKIAWAQKAIMNVKNTRSVLDAVIVDNSSELVLRGGFDWFRSPYYFDDEEITTGDGIEDWIEESTDDIAYTDVSRTDEGVTG